MALGKRTVQQREMFVPVAELPKSPAHPFYSRLNQLLAEAGFDEFVEGLCAPHYKEGGRPSIPPGIYFRMLFIGYFEGIDSQRGIAWRCADSRSLLEFLGAAPTDTTPAHNSMTVIRQRLPESVFDGVFEKVLSLLRERGLLKGKTLGVDATTLEANAAMKTIVRKADGKDWKNYLRTLAQAEGIEEPSDDDLRRIDRGRKDKKVSNETWKSPVDGDARIARMKDGTSHLAYKAEHAVDLETEAIVNAQISTATRGDGETGMESVILAQVALSRSGSGAAIQELVADKGYHDNGLLSECAHFGIRTYIPERKQAKRVWTNKPAEVQDAFRANRRRVRGVRGAALEPVAERAGGTDLCPRLRNRRWETNAAPAVDQRPEGAPAAVLCLQFGVGNEEMLRNEQAAQRRGRHDLPFDPICGNGVQNHRTQSRGCIPSLADTECTDLPPIRCPRTPYILAS